MMTVTKLFAIAIGLTALIEIVPPKYEALATFHPVEPKIEPNHSTPHGPNKTELIPLATIYDCDVFMMKNPALMGTISMIISVCGNADAGFTVSQTLVR